MPSASQQAKPTTLSVSERGRRIENGGKGRDGEGKNGEREGEEVGEREREIARLIATR